MTTRQELVEYFWDETTQVGDFVYETDDPEEPTIRGTKFQPLEKPEATEELKLSYYADLLHWIRTQA